jgi:hypothetical protein
MIEGFYSDPARRGVLETVWQHEALHALASDESVAMLRAAVTGQQYEETRQGYIGDSARAAVSWATGAGEELFADFPRMYGYDPAKLPFSSRDAYRPYFDVDAFRVLLP